MLLNVTEFPICVSFGDRDYLGSEGADMIIKSNKFFATGESQLILVPNCGHAIINMRPDYLVEMLKGFSDGTMRGRYEEKPRTLFVPKHVHAQK